MLKTLKIYFLLVLVVACVEPYDLPDTSVNNMLAVESVFSNQLKRHKVFLTRTTSLDNRRIIRERGAAVTISDEEGSIIVLTESTPGVYETPIIAAQAGKVYTLKIETADGKVYASQKVPFKDGVDIGNVYTRYINKDDPEKKGLQIYVDTEDPTNQTRFYRWNYIETYEVQTPFPSTWVWLGGNEVEFREERIDICYASDTLRNILTRSSNGLDQDKITEQPIRFIPANSYITRNQYSILVQQFCLSAESYLYWENQRIMSEQQGSLSDIQPGSILGNISAVGNDEPVLGYFDVCRVSEKRINFSAIDFYDEGFKMPANFRSYCHEVMPINVMEGELGDAMARYERTMYIWEASGLSPFTIFHLMPKNCCDCRNLGPTERPEFFD